MVIGMDGGKINLSIKRLEAKPQRDAAPKQGGNNFRSNAPRRENNAPAQNRPVRSTPTPPPAPKTADQLFEERLKQFMTESDSKLSSLRQYADHRSKTAEDKHHHRDCRLPRQSGLISIPRRMLCQLS